MNALEVLGYMAVETNIAQVRNKIPAVVFKKVDLYAEGSTLLLLHPEIIADTWEIGWECSKCCGTGIVSGYTGNKNNPDYVESSCPDCDDGIIWEKEY